jgi:hypothetical protein
MLGSAAPSVAAQPWAVAGSLPDHTVAGTGGYIAVVHIVAGTAVVGRVAVDKAAAGTVGTVAGHMVGNRAVTADIARFAHRRFGEQECPWL